MRFIQGGRQAFGRVDRSGLTLGDVDPVLAFHRFDAGELQGGIRVVGSYQAGELTQE